MEGRWIKRRAHPRRLQKGRLIQVRESWALSCREGGKKTRTFRGPCPGCGARIRSVNMPNKGWAHFEGDSQIKHPCFDVRSAALKRGNDGNLDLFEEIAEEDEKAPPLE